MKINLLKSGSIVILCALSIGFYACIGEGVIVSDDKNESPYERIGRLHNEGLDYVWEKIVATAPLTKSGGREIPAMNEIQQMCNDFACSKGYRVEAKNGENERESMVDFSFLSEPQQEWLRQIKEIVWTATPDKVEEFIMVIKTLEQKLQQDEKISDAEKKILFYTMAVCRYSAQYWADNYEKWQVELFGMNKVTKCSVKTKSEDGEFVTEEWWEAYKEIVWLDGCSGIRMGDGYYLEDANVGSIKAYLN